MNLGIRGRRAIVAGGSVGLGYASAAMLAAEGVELFLSARGADRLRASAVGLAAESGARVTPVVADHGTEAGRRALVDACPEPDIVIITCSPPRLVDDYTSITADEWRSSLETTAIGPIELIKSVLPGMVERRFGRIVNIATVGVKRPSEARVLSGASRAALCNYAAAIAKKVARYNVTINNLLPGMFATPGAEELLKNSAPTASGTLVKNPMGDAIPPRIALASRKNSRRFARCCAAAMPGSSSVRAGRSTAAASARSCSSHAALRYEGVDGLQLRVGAGFIVPVG